MKRLILITISVIYLALAPIRQGRKSSAPGEFEVDTIKVIDKKKRMEIFLTIPRTGIKNLDSKVRRDILKDKQAFEAEINERITENEGDMSSIGSDYSCILENTFKNQALISYNFINSEYFGGSAHGISRFKCYNYDLKKKKLILFKDYFAIRSKKDTLFLLNLVTHRIDRRGVTVNTLDGLKFNVTADSLFFNFDDYEIGSYAEGLIRAGVSKKEIAGIINSTYQ